VPPRPHLLLATAAVAAAADDEDSGGDEREQGADSLAATPERVCGYFRGARPLSLFVRRRVGSKRADLLRCLDVFVKQ